MSELDDFVDRIDVDAALGDVIARHGRDERRRRRQHAALAVAVAALVLVVGVVAWPRPSSDTSVDVAGTGGAEPIGAAAAPPCSTTPAIIDASREALRSSPLAAIIDRASPGTLAALGIAEGELVTEGRILAVRPVGSSVVPTDGLPDAPGGPLAWSGVEVVVSTEAGEVTAPVALAMGGVPVMEANRPSTAALEALVGACVVVQHGTGAGVPPLGQGSPRILALATDPSSAPVALDEFYDSVLSGFATPAELVIALRTAAAEPPP